MILVATATNRTRAGRFISLGGRGEVTGAGKPQH